MVIQHNLEAMNSNRMLGITNERQVNSMTKLSSGYQINKAADNAAGLAVSEKMRKQIRGLDQGSTNSEDGISCVQTAEGALEEVHNMLQRINELLVQSANGTNSDIDRTYIQDEIDQIIDEIDRVSQTTKFNEIPLLKGDEKLGTHNTYITRYAGEEVTKIDRIAITTTSIPGGAASAIPANVIFNGQDNSTIYYWDNTSNKLLTTTINNGQDISDIYNNSLLDLKKLYKDGTIIDYTCYGVFVYTNESFADIYTFTDASHTKGAFNREMYFYMTKPDNPGYKDPFFLCAITPSFDNGKYYDTTDPRDYDTGIVNFGSITQTTGWGYAALLTSKYIEECMSYSLSTPCALRTLRLVSDLSTVTTPLPPTPVSITRYETVEKKFTTPLYDAAGIEVSEQRLGSFFDEDGKYKGGLFARSLATPGDEIFASYNTNNTTNLVISDFIQQRITKVNNDLALDIQAGSESKRNNKVGISIASINSHNLGIAQLKGNSISIVDHTGTLSTDALDIVSQAINKVSSQRSQLGAEQNRLEHTINNLDNVVENTTSSESKMRDTDMAKEMVQYSNSKILTQAGQSVLSQANQNKGWMLNML